MTDWMTAMPPSPWVGSFWRDLVGAGPTRISGFSSSSSLLIAAELGMKTSISYPPKNLGAVQLPWLERGQLGSVLMREFLLIQNFFALFFCL